MAGERVILPWEDMVSGEQAVYETDFLEVIADHSDNIVKPRREGVDAVTSSALGFWEIIEPELFGPDVNALEFRLGSWTKDNVVRFHNTTCLVVARSIEDYVANPFTALKKITGGIGFREHEHEMERGDKGKERGYFRSEAEGSNNLLLVSQEDMADSVDGLIRRLQALKKGRDIRPVSIDHLVAVSSQMTIFD